MGITMDLTGYDVPRRTRSHAAVKGFTLIELLVVVAIIALLAAILFPVFGRARENARRATCQSNLKQIGLGLIQYAQDYDEQQPLTTFGGNGGSNAALGIYKWMDAIYPYVKSEQVFKCPSDAVSAATPYRYYMNASNPSFAFGSYVYNNGYADDSNGCSAKWGQLGPKGRKLAQIMAPATTIWIMEQNVQGGGNGGGNSNNVEIWWGSYQANPVLATNSAGNIFLDTGSADVPQRHLDTTPALYCDGHVKSAKLEALVATKNIFINNVGAPCGGPFALRPVMTAFTIQDD